MSDATSNRITRLITDESKRKKIVSVVAYGAFVVVMTAVEALAVRGQLDFGTHVLDLSGTWLVVPPVALEAGGLTWAALSLWQALTPDSSTAGRAVTRLGTIVAVGAAAAANWIGAEAAGRSNAAAAYLAGASVMALAMWHVILHGVRHVQLRTVGAIEPPLPRFRALRWLVSPRETARAYALAIREGVTSPVEAIARVRASATEPAPAAAAQVDAGVDERQVVDATDAPLAIEPAPAPRTTQRRNDASAQTRKSAPRRAARNGRPSKADRLRAMFARLGEADVPRALAELAREDPEFRMDRSNAYAIAREWSPTEQAPTTDVPSIARAADDTDSHRLEESA